VIVKTLPDMDLRKTLQIAAPALLALIVLNVGLAHHNIWPTLMVRATTELSLELVVLVTMLALLSAGGIRIGTRTQWLLSALVLLFVVGRYVDVTAPALFGRRIDLYWDSQHLPAIVGMAFESRSPFFIAAILIAVLSLFAALLLIIRTSLAALCQAIARPAFRNIAIAVGALLLSFYAAGMNSSALDWERRFAIPITPVYFEQASAIAARATGKHEPVEFETASLPVFAELNGNDVIVIFLESYGRIALDDEAYAEQTHAALAELQKQLTGEGWQSRSAYLTPPTFGGASWLSHSSFLAGRAIESHDLYQTFLHSQNETLTDRFRKAGYRSVLLTPGIRGPWPEGLALRFDRIAAAKDVDYQGQGFGWWYVPDQYSLDWLARSEINIPERAPLFAMFPTIMSHFPFGPVPPYLDDWNALSSNEPFDAQAVEQTVALGDAFSGEPESAYLRVILYNLKTVSGFVAEHAPDDAIIIALGDHQPPAAISGEGAEWDVPIHVFARDANLLAPYERSGFVEGIIPQGVSVHALNELASLILEALEKPTASSRIAEVE
jgi:hypothetical protein